LVTDPVLQPAINTMASAITTRARFFNVIDPPYGLVSLVDKLPFRQTSERTNG
jgi:hypothetical protein